MEDKGMRAKMYDLVDWGAKAAILGLLSLAVNSLRDMARAQEATKLEITDMKSESKRVADKLEYMAKEFYLRIETLAQRVDRIERAKYDQRHR
jgi:hypothetical protein